MKPATGTDNDNICVLKPSKLTKNAREKSSCVFCALFCVQLYGAYNQFGTDVVDVDVQCKSLADATYLQQNKQYVSPKSSPFALQKWRFSSPKAAL